METKISDQNIRSLSIKLWGFRSQEKTTRTILIISSARKTTDHACSRESKIIQIVRLSTKLDDAKKVGKIVSFWLDTWLYVIFITTVIICRRSHLNRCISGASSSLTMILGIRSVHTSHTKRRGVSWRSPA